MKKLSLALLVTLPTLAFAEPPGLLGYQGRLVKMDGTPETGTAQVRFGLFAADTGGASLWEETQAVTLQQGYYSTYLGRVTSFPATLFDTNTLWLELSVQAPGDTQFRTMTPRQRVGSVAFALVARSVQGGPVDATSISVNGTPVIDASGRLTATAGYSAGSGISIDGTTRAISIASSGCATGQVLQWSGTTWQCAAVSGTGGVSGVSGTAPITVMNGTTTPVVSVAVGTTAGTVAAGNDSRFGNATSLSGQPVSSSVPTMGQVLAFNGTAWTPQSVSAGGGVTSVIAGAGLTGGTITSTGTIAIADGGVGSAQLAAGAVTFDKLAATGCGPNQVLRFNGTTWGCASLSANPTAPSLIANFEFEETGTTFTDTSGLGNNATFSSGLTAGAIGHTGSGANFSGGVATVAMGNTIPDPVQVQVEAWIWPTVSAVSGAGVIAARPGQWSLRYLTGAPVSDLDFTVTTRGAPATCTVSTSRAGISVSGWSHVGAFYDGLNVHLTINGQVVARAPCAKGALAATPGAPLTIGGTASGERYLGFLDELRVRSFAQIPVSDLSDELDPFPGSGIVNRAQGRQINRWASKERQRWRRCFQKTAGNNTPAQLHAACDFLGPSVVLAQFSNGRVLGGHTSTSWSAPGGGFYRSYDSNAFLFSITANKKYPHANYQTETIYNFSDRIAFGNGHDLFIGGATLDSYYCNFPFAYACNQQVNINASGDACAQELCGSNRTQTQTTGITQLELWVEDF